MSALSHGVILAAGAGTRLLPLTATRPKPMLPVAGKPLLQYNLEQLAQAGVREVAVVVSAHGDALRRHFGERWQGMHLRYVVQGQARGTGDALRLAAQAVGARPFICIFGDNLTAWPAAQLLAVHREMKASATLALFRAPNPRQHGVVELEGRTIRSIVERPEHPPSDLACAGMFVFEREIFDALDAIEPAPNGELLLPDAVQHLISCGRVVSYDILDQWRVNINTPQELLEANRQMLARTGGGADSSQVRPPAFVPQDVVIEPDACVGPYVCCGRGCTIGNAARVAESILLDGSTVGAGARVERSILGECATVAPGAVVVERVVADYAECR